MNRCMVAPQMSDYVRETELLLLPVRLYLMKFTKFKISRSRLFPWPLWILWGSMAHPWPVHSQKKVGLKVEIESQWKMSQGTKTSAQLKSERLSAERRD